MTEVNKAATRVFPGQYDEVDGDGNLQVMTFNIPRFLSVHIPAINETRVYDLLMVAESQIIAGLEHGLSQKLGDAAAGKTGEKAEEAVTKREKTLWADGRTSARIDPVLAEMYEIVCNILRRPKTEGGKGLKTKELPTMREFPEFLKDQDQDAVAKIRTVAEANVKAMAEAKAGLTL